ncbi:hypothetical protein HCB38_00970 [Listeria sp. FSL L7-0083]|uniref:hypothetical protein n=1 Tax=Listeria farberi TaxID=2713500 RepID=UPI001629F457|nr:hypothetical protein [Listeria farberi]MBC2266390.1 hypothetical protein [Listeria farberi]
MLIMFGFYKKTLSDKTLPDSFQTVFLIGTFVFIVLLFVIQLHKKTIFLWILTVFCFFILLLVLLATFQNVWLLPFFNVCFDWIKANSVIAIYGAIFLSGGSLYILGKANAHYKIFTKK